MPVKRKLPLAAAVVGTFLLVLGANAPAASSASRKAPTAKAIVGRGVNLGESAPIRALAPSRAKSRAAMLGTTLNGINVGETGNKYLYMTGAVGPNHVVQIASGQMKICAKPVTSCAATFPVARLFQQPAFQVSQCYDSLDTDGQVAYDTLAGRWVVVASSTDTLYPGVCFAVSASNDPNGTYYRYFFLLTAYQNGAKPISPSLGIWPDGYYVGFDGTVDPLVPGFSKPVFVFQRSQMLVNGSAASQGFAGLTWAVVPTNLTGGITSAAAPPPGAPNQLYNYEVQMVDEDGTEEPHIVAIEARAFHVDWNNPANSNINTLTRLSIPARHAACHTNQDDPCVPQPNGVDGVHLGAHGGKLFAPINYRNMGAYQSTLVAHNTERTLGNPHIDPFTGIEWHELRFNGSTPFIRQGGVYSQGGDHVWMPALAMNRNGDIAMGYNASSTTVKPSIRVTGRLAADPLNTISGQGVTNVLTSSTTIDDNTLRALEWGPQTMATDPDGCTFWLFGNYVRNSGWASRISSTTLPNCNTDLALNKSIIASSAQTNYPATRAVDGNSTTAWRSAAAPINPQWIRVDLGTAKALTSAILRFETNNHPTTYQIQGSNNATSATPTWTTLRSSSNSSSNVVAAIAGSYRWVRLYMTNRGGSCCYGVLAFQITGSY